MEDNKLRDLIENGSNEKKCSHCKGTGMSLVGIIIIGVPVCMFCGGTGKEK